MSEPTLKKMTVFARWEGHDYFSRITEIEVAKVAEIPAALMSVAAKSSVLSRHGTLVLCQWVQAPRGEPGAILTFRINCAIEKVTSL